MKFKYLLPLLVALSIVILLWRSLALHPTQIPSPLIDKPAPQFQLPSLLNAQKMITNKDFLGQVTLFNVWATWCEACAEEHDFLLQLANRQQVILFGLNYKDDPVAARKLLKQAGNPYKLIAVDKSGDAAIDWGVYGTPETFVIDKKGMIRYKQTGAITPEIWQQQLQPLIQRLQSAKN